MQGVLAQNTVSLEMELKATMKSSHCYSEYIKQNTSRTLCKGPSM